MRMRTLSILGVGLLVMVVMGACGSSSVTPTPSPPAPTTVAADIAAAASPTPAPVEPTATVNSAGSATSESPEKQNESGQEVFSQKCTECHGTSLQGTGAGPALTAFNLLPYANAQKLLSFISSRMPANSPGSRREETWTAGATSRRSCRSICLAHRPCRRRTFRSFAGIRGHSFRRA